jgi:hypothetical protein
MSKCAFHLTTFVLRSALTNCHNWRQGCNSEEPVNQTELTRSLVFNTRTKEWFHPLEWSGREWKGHRGSWEISNCYPYFHGWMVVRGVIRVYDGPSNCPDTKLTWRTNERVVPWKCGTCWPKEDEGSTLRSNKIWCSFKVIICPILALSVYPISKDQRRQQIGTRSSRHIQGGIGYLHSCSRIKMHWWSDVLCDGAFVVHMVWCNAKMRWCNAVKF